MPERIQLRRTKGWRKPEGAIVVARPSKWGNPVRWDARPSFDPDTGERTPADPAEARRISLEGFLLVLAGRGVTHDYPSDDEIQAELAGHDLACWCPLEDASGERSPCHADVLLELANRPSPKEKP